MAKQNDKTDELIAKAKRRFARCEDRESTTRLLWKADLKFANGDPDNGYQWDEAMARQRTQDRRPFLTVNKVKQHNRQITNDARQNKPAVRVYPVDDGADKDTAEVFNGVIRHIESNSSADTAYDTAGEFAVDAGLGYWRIITDYADEKSFDQEIYIKTVKNPLNVYLDPDIQEADGSDMRFAFVFEDMPKEVFEEKYPDAEPVSWTSPAGDSWMSKETIRVAEYYEIVEVKDTLCLDANSGETFMLSEVEDKAMAKQIKADQSFRKRAVSKRTCKWYLIAGDQILDQTDWLGKYIPIVRVVGDEVEIDGKVDRKGHTRAMKDAQRMYNYNSSAAIEYGALQTKTPIIAAAEAIEGYEHVWDRANTENLAYLPWNAHSENGEPIPMPQRMVAPAPAQLFLQGMQTASEEMKMASGQYDASMGAKSNETSGRAIVARQREGDTATFHFIDNIARAIKYTGKILVDLIPKIYDTESIKRMLGEDGTQDEVKLDPNQQQAMTEKQGQDGKIEKIYNLAVGRYDVTVSVGPSYGSKRAEAFQAMTEMASRSPNLMAQAGDLIFKAADFPMADKIAERLEKALPPELRDEDEGKPQIPPEVQQQMRQMQQHNQELEKNMQQLGEQYNELKSNAGAAAEDRRIKAYMAHTARLAVIKDKLTPELAAQLAYEVGLDVRQDDIDGMTEQTEQPANAGFFSPEQGAQEPTSPGTGDAL
ncbi:portal protein [Massilia sp. PWRC2]|uniref:portal protein n=1 Tax=Massilia sp. PWRC2 TaxID=2804626 RepID=UPI003CEC1D13